MVLNFRAKITDLATEISKMQKEIDTFNQENSTFLNYEKRYGLGGLEILIEVTVD